MQADHKNCSAAQAAVRCYRELGYSVCRLRPGEKRPTYAGWSTRSLEADEFKDDDGIGLVCGPTSATHALVCVDLDSADAIARADEFLPHTAMIDGRKGKPRSHRWYLVENATVPPECVSKAEQAAPAAVERHGHAGPFKKQFGTAAGCAIDFIGSGGQAAVPPSMHHSGEVREWEGGAPGEPHVTDFPTLWAAVNALAAAVGCDTRKVPAPTDPFDRDTAAQHAPTLASGWEYAADQDDAERRYATALRADVEGEGLPRTGRSGDRRTFHLLARGFDFGLRAERVLAVFVAVVNVQLVAVNDAWTDAELRRKVETIERRGPLSGFVADDEPPLRWDDARRLACELPGRELIRFRGKDAFRYDGTQYLELPEVELHNLTRTHAELRAEAEYRYAANRRNLQLATVDREIEDIDRQLAALGSNGPADQLSRLRNQRSDAERRKKGIKPAPATAPRVTAAVVRDAVESLRASRALPPGTPFNVHLSDFRPRHWLACSNGIIDLDTFALRPHDPEWFSPVVVPVAFDAAAPPPTRFLEFIARVSCGNAELAAVLQEVVGACLDSCLKVQFFAVLVGEGQNGKSVLLAVLRALLGAENISAIDLAQLSSGSHRFASFGLLGKMANICADQSYFDTEDASELKKLTGGDACSFEAKGRQPVVAVNTAKFVIACNELPRLRDKTSGVWRRMVAVPFGWRVPDGDANPRMLNEDFWRDELPGILNWGMAGLRRLHERGRFELPQVCRELVAEHRMDSNPARRFLNEHYRETGSGNDFVAGDDAYRAYRDWCAEDGVRSEQQLNRTSFGREIQRAFPAATKGSKKVGGTTKRGWFGVVRMTGSLSVTAPLVAVTAVTAGYGGSGGSATASGVA